VLRENGFATVRAEGTRRLYSVDARPLEEVDMWLERFRRFWNQRLDALATELARGKRERRAREQAPDDTDKADDSDMTAHTREPRGEDEA
jgi:hypothetical protein